VWCCGNHILFNCVLPKFMWSCVRESMGCSWNPQSCSELLNLLRGLRGSHRRVVWYYFAAQSWALWNMHNKLAMKKIIPGHTADCIFETISFFQLWLPLGKERDKAVSAAALTKLKQIHTINRQPSTSSCEGIRCSIFISSLCTPFGLVSLAHNLSLLLFSLFYSVYKTKTSLFRSLIWVL
jgi:hypothetical protein